MAVGDAVIAESGANAILDFQPAAGVECCITSVWTGTALATVLYDGTNVSIANSDTPKNEDMAIMINNTNYLRIVALGASTYSCYTGITIK